MTAQSMLTWLGGLRHRLRLLRVVISVILLAALAAGGALALRVLRPAAPIQILPGQSLAWEIARAAGRSEGVQFVSGAYLPGDRMLLYARTAEADRARVRNWAALQLEPFAERLAAMSASEQLTWVIDFGPPPGEQEAITLPLRRAADLAYYRYVSSAPGLLGAAAAPDQPQTSAAPPAPQATAAPDQPQATAAPAVGTPSGTPLLNTAFDEASGAPSAWLPLSGVWAVKGGIYNQGDNTGYDFISMLNVAPQTHYMFEAKLRLGEGEMGGGFVYNVPDTKARTGAQIVDFDLKGSFLRWGRYDDKGAYVYEGGVKLDAPISDGGWHNLRLVTHGAASMITLDGRQFGPIKNTSASGHVGLIASKTKVDFDNVALTALPETGGVPLPQPTAAPAPATSFRDDFADGNAQGWQVLSGTWQIVEGAYQQTDLNGSDLGSVTPFTSDSFTMTVRLKRIAGDIGAGLYFNMDKRDSKARSQMINYTQVGKAIQWGHFDDGGNFVFEGSAPVPDGNDGAWHTIGVRVKAGAAAFSLDGKEIATAVKLAYAGGYVGLLSSHSRVAFDDVTISAQ